jgi:hypothetical protein
MLWLTKKLHAMLPKYRYTKWMVKEEKNEPGPVTERE